MWNKYVANHRNNLILRWFRSHLIFISCFCPHFFNNFLILTILCSSMFNHKFRWIQFHTCHRAMNRFSLPTINGSTHECYGQWNDWWSTSYWCWYFSYLTVRIVGSFPESWFRRFAHVTRLRGAGSSSIKTVGWPQPTISQCHRGGFCLPTCNMLLLLPGGGSVPSPRGISKTKICENLGHSITQKLRNSLKKSGVLCNRIRIPKILRDNSLLVSKIFKHENILSTILSN